MKLIDVLVRDVVSSGMYPGMTEAECRRIIEDLVNDPSVPDTKDLVVALKEKYNIK